MLRRSGEKSGKLWKKVVGLKWYTNPSGNEGGENWVVAIAVNAPSLPYLLPLPPQLSPSSRVIKTKAMAGRER
eukprot:16359750-Heterocapsa_arctica.AAC.1